MKVLKYKVTENHPFLKPGLIMSKYKKTCVLFHEFGGIKYDIDEFDEWIEKKWIKIYDKNKIKDIDLSLNSIKNAVFCVMNADNSNLSSSNRFPENAYIKRLFCYFAKTYSNYSMREIGNYIRDGYDHSTVHWAHKKISGLINFDLATTSDVYAIKKQLNLIK